MDYDALFDALQPAAPTQNLNRSVEFKTSTILRYVFTMRTQATGSGNDGIVKGLLDNGYNAQTNCRLVNGAMQFTGGSYVSTPLAFHGHNFTLSFTLIQTSATAGHLFTERDSKLKSGIGSSSAVMLVSAGNAFALNYRLPIVEYVDASLIGRSLSMEVVKWGLQLRSPLIVQIWLGRRGM